MGSIRHDLAAGGQGALRNIGGLYVKVGDDFAKPSGVLGLDVGYKDRIEGTDGSRPDFEQGGKLRSCVEQNASVAATFRYDIGVCDADPVGHPKCVQTEREAFVCGDRVGAAGEGAQTDFVEIEHTGKALQFLGVEFAAPVQGIEQTVMLQLGFARRNLGGETGKA